MGEDDDGEGKAAGDHGRVALVLLAEAHVTVPVALRHAGVVHHEKVHVETVCAGSLDLIVL